MPARARRSLAAATAAASALTGSVLLTGCVQAGTAATGPAAPATPAAARPAVALAKTPCRTAHGELTISNGTRYVWMNGTRVDFGTPVHDLTWSPDGSRAAFIDGDGNLVTAAPDGSKHTTVVKHTTGQALAHPAWWTVKFPGTDNQGINYAATAHGTTTLQQQQVTDQGVAVGPPSPFWNNYSQAFRGIPRDGNTWPSAQAAPAAASPITVFGNTRTGEVYINDSNERSGWTALAAGTEPAVCADGSEAVFVRSVRGHDHVFEKLRSSTAPARDLTPGASADYTDPALSPDGSVVAVRTLAGTALLPVDGGGRQAPDLLSTDRGLPSYRP